MIELTRPLCFIDIEATGIDPQNDRIVELSVLKIFPDGTRKIVTRRFNPTIPIPESATAIHGISDADVAQEADFATRAPSVMLFIKDCDLAGFNSNKYDVPLLFAEFQRAGLYLAYENICLLDVGNIFKINESRTLAAAVKFYCNKELDGAHGAEADIEATYEVFLAQLDKYPDMPKGLPALAKYSNYDRDILDLSGKFTRNEEGEVCFNFGKSKGVAVHKDMGFLEWMLFKDFAADTLKLANELYLNGGVLK